MATKDLSRTVIEGGRAGFNRGARRFSNSVHLMQVRLACARLVAGHEADSAVYPVRRPVWAMFDDKLAAAYRWLRSNVGRRWNKVRSELFSRFDTRTTAGRHIVFEHLLQEVALCHDDPRLPWRRFYLDRGGNLRESATRKRRLARPRLPEPESCILEWLCARRVAVHGSKLYWLVLTQAGGYRQTSPLTEAERARWLALPERYRERYSGSKTMTPEE